MAFKKDITFKEFIKFLLPSIAVMAFMSTYAIIDGFFISKYAGSDALAAVNLILPVNSIIFSVGLMFAAGGGAFATIKLAEGDYDASSKFFSNLLMVAFGFALVIMTLGLTFKDGLMSFLGVNELLRPYASVYSTYLIVTLPFLISKMIFAGFLRASGKPDISLKMSLIGGFSNMFLDYIFVAKLSMGVAGAGLATMLGIIIALVYAASYFASSNSAIKFILAPIDFKLIWQTMVNGSSEMVSEFAIGFSTFVLNILTVKYLANNGVAAIAVILYINLFVSVVYQGIAIGTAPLLSFHYGAKNFATLAKVRRYARKTLLSVSLLLTALVYFNSSNLVSIFFSSKNAAHTVASNGLAIVAFAYLFMGANMYGSSMYTAFSNGKISAVISFSKTFIIFVAVAYIMPKAMGAKGIWLIVPTVELITSLGVFYLTRDRQLEKYTELKTNGADHGIEVAL